MIRREFLASASAGAVAASGALGSTFTGSDLIGSAAFGSAQPQPGAGGGTRAGGKFRLKYAPHFGMFGQHAPDDLDQLRFAADQGFEAWEDNGMSGRGAEFQDKFAALSQKLGIQMGIFVAQSIDWENPTLTTGDESVRERFVTETAESCEVAKRVGATWVTTVVGRVSQHLPWGHQFTNVVETLKRASEAIEKAKSNMVMALEPLNWRDHPGQFLATSDTIRALCKAVDSPHCRILQDLYHLQVTEGNLIDNMNRSWDYIGYFQLGDNPGRQEPGTGEVNYRNVFRHIHSRGYAGILGMEHGKSKPGKEGELALIKAYRDADSF
jgi:hydroxypyruvate isomerase